MRLIYLSPVPWTSFAQRPHKFVQWYHERTGETVLWVDPYPTRLPRWADLARLRSSSSSLQLNSTPAWITVLKPGALPIEPLPGSGWINGKIWRRLFFSIDGFVGGAQILLAIGKPSILALKLLERFKEYPSLYDAMDEFPAFYSGFSNLSMARRECNLVDSVERIWVSSSALQSRWSRHRSDVILVRNALDPALIPDLSKKADDPMKRIFGYVGTIASWFDWEWVFALASARSGDEIRLIGPVFNSPTKDLPPNVVLLPPCSHDAALLAMREFDVGIIPFVRSGLTNSVDPIKYYEYKALGLPVISTNFGEMGFHSANHGVFISQSLDDVASLADAALRVRSNAVDVAAFRLENSWSARFDAAQLI